MVTENGLMKTSLMEVIVKGSNFGSFIIGLLMLNIVLLGWLANSASTQANELKKLNDTVIGMEVKVAILWEGM